MRFFRRSFYAVAVWVIESYIRIKFWLFAPYIDRLLIQAHAMYTWTPMYKERWEAMGLAYANRMYDENAGEMHHYFNLARKSPLQIRARLFIDALLDRKKTAYYIKDE